MEVIHERWQPDKIMINRSEFLAAKIKLMTNEVIGSEGASIIIGCYAEGAKDIATLAIHRMIRG